LQKPGRNNDLFVLLYRASAFIRERRAQFRPSVRLSVRRTLYHLRTKHGCEILTVSPQGGA